MMNGLRRALILALVSLAFMLNPGVARSATQAGPAELDAAFQEGRAAFYKELRLACGLHPQKYLLGPSSLARIEEAETKIAGLYENLMNIVYPGKEELRPLRERYIELARQTARMFVESLFLADPRHHELLEQEPFLGLDRLSCVLLSLGRNDSPAGLKKDASFTPGAELRDDSWLFRVARFEEAQKITRGRGIKIAVIDSGYEPQPELAKNLKVEHDFDYCLLSRTVAPWKTSPPDVRDEMGRGTLMTALASRCAPEAQIRIYKVFAPPSPFPYWQAMELSRAIRRATEDKNDIIVTGVSLGRNFEFLKQACQFAYERNVIIVAPNNDLTSDNPEVGSAFPAHYTSAIAVAGAISASQGSASLWDKSAPSHHTLVAAPASFSGVNSHAFAAATCAGLTGLISAALPRTERDLQGQYVQRMMEILAKTADPQAFGFKSYDAGTGYGLIDAAKAVGPGLQAYIKKMNAVEANYQKRMAERQKEAEKDRKQALKNKKK